jgi:hypothetical protein
MLDKAPAFEIKGIDLMGTENHLEGELQNGDFPSVINSFDDGAGRIPRATNVLHDPLSNRIHAVMDDFFVDLTPLELKAVLQKGKILAFRAEFFDELVEACFGRWIEAVELHFIVAGRAKNPRAHGFDFSGANPDFTRAVHQLADELELEPSLTESIYPAIRLAKNLGCFERVVDVVLRMHWQVSVTHFGNNAKKRADIP